MLIGRANELDVWKIELTPPPFATPSSASSPSPLWLFETRFLLHITRVKTFTMSDLYTALRLSPRKKRTLPEDDDNVLTPKRLRHASVVFYEGLYFDYMLMFAFDA